MDKAKENHCKGGLQSTSGICDEVKETWYLSWVLIVISGCVYAMQPITTMFGGHHSKLQLDALALVNSLINVLGWSTITGFASVCDTFFSQSFGGKNYKLLGISLQRCLIVHGFLLSLLLVLCINIGHVLLWFDQDPEIVELTSQYMVIYSPALIAMTVYIVLREYIYTQNIVYPDLFISASALLLHILIQYTVFEHTSYGLNGSAAGQVIVNVYMMITTIIYVVYSGLYQRTEQSWTLAAFSNWGETSRLGLYGAFLVCFEWWAFEASIFLAGILGTTELAAQSIVTNVDFLLYSFMGGYSTATSIRVGWALGQNLPDRAVQSCTAGMILIGSTQGIISLGMVLFRDEIPYLFISNEDVIKLTSNMLVILALYMFLDGFSAVTRGAIRGAGKQKLGTIVVIITYYFIGLPFGIPLMFKTPLKLYGIWIGYITITAIGLIIYIIVVYCGLDWSKLAKETKSRIHNESNQSLEHMYNVKSQDVIDDITNRNDDGKKLLSNNQPYYCSLTEKNTKNEETKEENISDDYYVSKTELRYKICIIISFVALFVAGVILHIVYPIG